jgi:hypothetical protein
MTAFAVGGDEGDGGLQALENHELITTELLTVGYNDGFRAMMNALQ